MIDHSHPSGLPPDPNEPKFSRDELDLVQFDDADGELAREDEQAVVHLREAGLDDEAIGRLRGRSVEEITKPERTAADVDRDLDEIRELRKSNRQKYWAKDTQAREAQLYAEAERLKASEASTEEKGEAGAIGDDGLPESIKAEWAKMPDGVDGAVKGIRSRVTLALGDLPDDAHEDLLGSFDRDLDDDARAAIASQLANDHGNAWAAASAQQVEEFREVEWGPPLLERWGKQGPKLLGIARKEGEAIMGALTSTSKLKLERWVAGKSASQKRAIIESLAARALRRL